MGFYIDEDNSNSEATTSPVSSPSMSGFFIDEGPQAAPPTFHQALEAQAGPVENIASGYLSGLAGLGDIANWLIPNSPETQAQNQLKEIIANQGVTPDLLEKLKSSPKYESFKAPLEELLKNQGPEKGAYLNSPEGQSAMEALTGPTTKGIGDYLRDAFDYSTGIENSTQINPEGFGHKIGSYLPAMMMGPGGIVEGGALKTATNLAKIGGRDVLAAGGGYLGKEYGGTPGEIVGSILTGSAPEILKGGIKGATNLLANVPNEDQALLQAFRVSDKEASKLLPVLKNAKEEGIIASGGATPFKDIQSRLQEALGTKEAAVQEVLSEVPNIKIADIMPNKLGIVDKLESGIVDKAASSAIKVERDNLTKIALSKLNPEDDADKLLSNYKSLARAAKTDEAAAEAFSVLKDQVDNVPITPVELRELRKSYDLSAKFDAGKPSETAKVYRGLRDDLQNKLLNLAGNKKEDLSQVFNEYSSLLGAKKPIEKLAGRELAGRTQEGGLIEKAIVAPVRKIISQKLGIGLPSSKKSVTLLKEAMGDTFVQQLANMKISPKIGPAVAPFLDTKKASKQEQPSIPSIREPDIIEQAVSRAEDKINAKAKDSIFDVPFEDLAKMKVKNSLFDMPLEDLMKIKVSDFPKVNPDTLKSISKTKIHDLPSAPTKIDPETITEKDLTPIIHRVIKQESGGNPDAKSQVGAQGLMQLMPKTGKELAKQIGETYRPTDPEQNVRLGTLYLTQQLEKYDGNVAYALAAYNFGPYAFDQYLKGNRKLPKETRDYVKNIAGVDLETRMV